MKRFIVLVDAASAGVGEFDKGSIPTLVSTFWNWAIAGLPDKKSPIRGVMIDVDTLAIQTETLASIALRDLAISEQDLVSLSATSLYNLSKSGGEKFEFTDFEGSTGFMITIPTVRTAIDYFASYSFIDNIENYGVLKAVAPHDVSPTFIGNVRLGLEQAGTVAEGIDGEFEIQLDVYIATVDSKKLEKFYANLRH